MKTKKEIILDLTPMLDVVFIVLLFLVLKSQNMVEKAPGSTDVPVDPSPIIIIEPTPETLPQYVTCVSITSRYDENDPSHRFVYIVKDFNQDDIVEKELYYNNTEQVYDEIRNTLYDMVSGSEGIPTVISLSPEDGSKMLYRDEVQLNNIMQEVRLSVSENDIYIK